MFDWYGNGEVTWSYPGNDDESRTTQASADFMRSLYRDVAAVVIGRRLFDMTNGWNGTPAAGERVFVVTHQPPTNWEHADRAPFTFIVGVEKAIAATKEFACDRVVDVSGGPIGSQALTLGLIGRWSPTRTRWSSAQAARSSPPEAWTSRCGWTTTTIVPGDRVPPGIRRQPVTLTSADLIFPVYRPTYELRVGRRTVPADALDHSRRRVPDSIAVIAVGEDARQATDSSSTM